MRAISSVGKLFMVAALAAAAGRAEILFDTTSALTLGDPTQTGRLSRNGVPQDWFGSEAFPGVINTTTTYNYHVYEVNVGDTPFIQVDIDSLSANTFFSAYDTSYSPDSAGSPNFGFDTNWLGDAGSSGDLDGVDPIFFQVVVPENHELLIVVNNTAASNVGVGDPFHLTVEGFIDSNFTDPSTAVPEPTTVFVCGGGLALMALARQRRVL
jgi:hypothetical protein